MTAYNEIRYNNPYANAGGLVLLSTQTASSSASISFTSGLTSAYKEYLFIFNNLHPATDATQFQFNLSTDSGSSYNVTKTTTVFDAYHDEADTDTNLGYRTDNDLAQSTSYQNIAHDVGADADQAVSGYLHLFAPSSNTFVKHFISTTSPARNNNYAYEHFTAGYANTVSPINSIDFKFSSGNIDDGTIQMFGVVS